MSRYFSCYLHKPGVLAPEVRIIACNDEDELQQAIFDQINTWPYFEVLDVYDEADEPVYRFSVDENPLQ